MAWTYIYGTSGYTPGSVSSYNLPLSTTVQVGDLLTLVVSGGMTTASVTTDPLGNTWTTDATETAVSPAESVIVLRSRVTNAGTYSSITITPGLAPQQFTAAFAQFRAAGGALTVTKSAGDSGTATSATSGTVAWSGDALLVGCWGAENGGTVTAGGGFTAGPTQLYVGGTSFGAALEYRLDDTSGSSSPGLTYSTTGAWVGIAVAYSLTASVATITPPSPASGATGQPSAAWNVSLDYPAPAGGLAIPLGTDVSGNTFSATSGGSAITSLPLAAGATSGTFYYTPNAAGTSHVTLGPTSGITFVGNGSAYTASGSPTPTPTPTPVPTVVVPTNVPPPVTATSFGKPTHWNTGQTADATTTTQATAYPIVGNFSFTEFATVAQGAGAILPQAIYPSRHEVVNDGANTLLVYPPSGGTVDGGAANAAYSLPAGSAAIFWLSAALTWKVVV